MNNFAGWALALALSPAALAPLPTWAADEPGEKSSLREAFPADDFTLREFMVPMRDGTKLYTLVVTPKHTTGPMPILLQRTPYDATRFLGKRATTSLEVMRGAGFAGGGYIFVTQDIRGRHKSEGTYAMYRVPRGEFGHHGLPLDRVARDALLDDLAQRRLGIRTRVSHVEARRVPSLRGMVLGAHTNFVTPGRAIRDRSGSTAPKA